MKDVTRDVENPGCTFSRLSRLRTNRPAVTIIRNESATWTTTSVLRRRGCSRTTPPPAALSAAATPPVAARIAGAAPERSAVTTATRPVKARMRQSGEAPTTTVVSDVVNMSTRSPAPQVAISRPPKAPIAASTAASATRSQARRGPLAPSARRSASSRSRAAPRAMSRLATLAQAMSSTPAAIAIRMRNDGASWLRSSAWPWLASTTWIRDLANCAFVSADARWKAAAPTSLWRMAPKSGCRPACARSIDVPGFSRA